MAERPKRNDHHLLPVRMFLTFIAVKLYEYTHKCLAFFMCHRARGFVSIGNSMKSADTSLKRRDRKKKATRDAIFRVAQKLFNQKGFDNTSVEDITEKVDIAQSTFFNYFPRKEDILVEIFKRKLPFLRKKCQEIVALDEPITGKIQQDLFNHSTHRRTKRAHYTGNDNQKLFKLFQQRIQRCFF